SQDDAPRGAGRASRRAAERIRRPAVQRGRRVHRVHAREPGRGSGWGAVDPSAGVRAPGRRPPGRTHRARRDPGARDRARGSRARHGGLVHQQPARVGAGAYTLVNGRIRRHSYREIGTHFGDPFEERGIQMASHDTSLRADELRSEGRAAVEPGERAPGSGAAGTLDMAEDRGARAMAPRALRTVAAGSCAACALVAAATLVPADLGAQSIRYPATKKVEVVDDYHGTQVADPYRWLEDTNAAETA